MSIRLGTPMIRGGFAIVAMGQFLRGFFLRMRGFFVFKNSWQFEDIFRKIKAFVKISILFGGNFKEIEKFFKVMRSFSCNLRYFERF
jgi:hypothetical protein